jgi:hypothetical protein
MTDVTETLGAPVAPGPTPPSSNGGPPRAGNATRTLAIVVGVAFLAGVLVARWLDWRTHAHPHV